MKRLNVGIVGCGWVAGWHVDDGFAHIPERFSILACCDNVDAARHRFAERHNIPRQARDLGELLCMSDIDVVVICTPPARHYEMVCDSLRAGKHVICEKPFTSSLALTDSIRELESRSVGRVMPVFQYRFGKGIAKVRHVIRSGLAGKHYVSAVETAKRRGPEYYAVEWRGKFATELGGVLLTQAIHVHDLLMWLIGPVSEVTCFRTTRVNPIEVEDCAVASLLMADGSLASLTATLGSVRQLTRLRLSFENVTFERQCLDDEGSRPGMDPWITLPADPDIGRAIKEKMDEVSESKAWFARQHELFHDAILSGGPFPVTLDDARASIELITALFHADETRGAVSLPIMRGHPKYEGWLRQGGAAAPVAEFRSATFQ